MDAKTSRLFALLSCLVSVGVATGTAHAAVEGAWVTTDRTVKDYHMPISWSRLVRDPSASGRLPRSASDVKENVPSR